MQELTFCESRVRIVEEDGQKWINANDVAKVLDYKNYRVAVNQFMESNKELLTHCVRLLRTQSRGDRGVKEAWFFNDKGLMAFLVKTNQPKAIPFQKWAIGVLAESVKEKVKELPKVKELRLKSAKVRNDFTDVLKDHGLNKPHEYIQITYTMKAALGIDKNRPKQTLDPWELIQVTMSELLSTGRLIESEAEGYYQVKPICQNASAEIAKIERKAIE